MAGDSISASQQWANSDNFRELFIALAFDNDRINNNLDSGKDGSTFANFFGPDAVNSFILKRIKEVFINTTFDEVNTLFKAGPQTTVEETAIENFNSAYSTIVARKVSNLNTSKADANNVFTQFMVCQAQTRLGTGWYDIVVSKLTDSDFKSTFKVDFKTATVNGTPDIFVPVEIDKPEETDSVAFAVWSATDFYVNPDLIRRDPTTIANAIRRNFVSNGSTNYLTSNDVPPLYFNTPQANIIVLGLTSGATHTKDTLALSLSITTSITITILDDLNTNSTPKIVVTPQKDIRVVTSLKALNPNAAWAYASIGTDTVDKIVIGGVETYPASVANVAIYAIINNKTVDDLVKIYRNTTAQNEVSASTDVATALKATTPTVTRTTTVSGGNSKNFTDVLSGYLEYINTDLSDDVINTAEDLVAFLTSDVLQGSNYGLMSNATTVTATNADPTSSTGFNCGSKGKLRQFFVDNKNFKLDIVLEALLIIANTNIIRTKSAFSALDVVRKSFALLEGYLDYTDVPSTSPVPVNSLKFYSGLVATDKTTVEHVKRLLFFYSIQCTATPLNNTENHPYLNLILRIGATTRVVNGVVVIDQQNVYAIQVTTGGATISGSPAVQVLTASGKFQFMGSSNSMYVAYLSTVGKSQLATPELNIKTFILNKTTSGTINTSALLESLIDNFGVKIISGLTRLPKSKAGVVLIVTPTSVPANSYEFAASFASLNADQSKIIKNIVGGTDEKVENLKILSLLFDIYSSETNSSILGQNVNSLLNTDEVVTKNFFGVHTYLNNNSSIRILLRLVMKIGDYISSKKYVSLSTVKGADSLAALKQHISEDTSFDTADAGDATDLTGSSRLTLSGSNKIVFLGENLTAIILKPSYVDPATSEIEIRITYKDFLNGLTGGKQHMFIAVSSKAGLDDGQNPKRLTAQGRSELLLDGMQPSDIDGAVYAVPAANGFLVTGQNYFLYVGVGAEGNLLFDEKINKY